MFDSDFIANSIEPFFARINLNSGPNNSILWGASSPDIRALLLNEKDSSGMRMTSTSLVPLYLKLIIQSMRKSWKDN